MAIDPAHYAAPAGPFEVRRATVDDIPSLRDLWTTAHLPADKLEKQFTEFQVALEPGGGIVAAIGLEINQAQGHVHSETFGDFSLTDVLRPQLWARLQSVAENHGLLRIWSQESAPFWKKEVGFSEASGEAKEKLPETFGPRDQPWLLLQLRQEVADTAALDRQIAVFKQVERAKYESMMQTGQTLRWIGTVIAILFFFMAIVALIYTLKQGPGIIRTH
jgi:N-acetylglutamate synthase-like GNAT family acetyltransferase